MKLHLKFTFILIFISAFSFAQNGNIYYLKKVLNTEDPTSLTENKELSVDVKNAVTSFSENLKKNKYLLFFNSKNAKYEKMKAIDGETLESKISSTLSGFNGKVFFDRENKTIITQKEIAEKTFLIKKEFDSIKWDLTNEKLIIDKLICYKATTKIIEEGRRGKKVINIIAWYAPEINLPYGPDGFGGLPGLIVQLEKGRIITYIDKIEYLKEEVKIILPKKGEIVSEKEFNSFMKDLALNRMKYFSEN